MSEIIIDPYDPEKHHLSWTDMLGREYRAGDLIAYATSSNHAANLTIGVVKRINSVDYQGKKLVRRQYNYIDKSYDEDILTATVTVTPLRRGGYGDGKNVTLTKLTHILKLDLTIADMQVELLNG